ncbi:tetratricopeptide repeat protein [Ferruginibacter sp. SUN106]|uniref:tetratricopeptide repeat protein n=1 Tax=Ferruginibacter sp. SUN106 TaxID=2978348 RepID=UPI003D3616FB
MYRIFLCCLLASIFSSVTKAQTIDDNIEKGVRLYNEMRAYEGKLTNATTKDSNITRLKNYIAEATPLFSGALSGGTAEQQKTARYFVTMLQYELGFVYGMKGENFKGYDVLKKIETDIRYYSDSANFPLRYKYTGKDYVIKYSNFAPTAAEYYTGMGEICTNTKKYDEAVGFMQQVISFPYTTPWFRYIAANKLWENRRYQNKRDEQYLQFTMMALQMCSRVDTMYQRLIRENEYAGMHDFADTLDRLIQQNPSWGKKGVVYATAATYFDSVKDNTAAIAFYRKAIAQDLSNKKLLKHAIDFALRTNNAGFQMEVSVAIATAAATEPDEVIRNLDKVLRQVVASANDPAKHFSEMRGKKMTSRRHSGKIYHASVELPGAIESFVTDFLDNNAANYYYWKSFIDEEEPAQLKGRLKERYKALCDEISSIYPDAAVIYQYNNENYFQIKLNKSTTIELNYYYNEGYKDVILLTVISSYPK